MAKTSKSITVGRSTVDRVVSFIGLFIAIGLVFLSAALFWAHDFIHSQVTEQLEAQKITFPAEDSAAFKALGDEDQKAIRPFAGQQLKTGAGAEAFANHYIAAHLKNIGDGKTYNELSAIARANPADKAAAAKVDQVFKGETLRGVLLNAYAFDTMAVVARIIAIAAAIMSAVLGLFVILGFQHAKKS